MLRLVDVACQYSSRHVILFVFFCKNDNPKAMIDGMVHRYESI